MITHTDQFMQELLDLESDTIAAEKIADKIYGAPDALTFFQKGLSKSEIKTMSEKAVESVLEIGNPLQVAEALSAMTSFIKNVEDDQKFCDYVREEAKKYPKGFISNSGAKIEVCESGTRYVFTNCADSVWDDFKKEKDEIDEQLKARETFLKTVPLSGLLVTNEQTGETTKIFPPAKSSTSSYKITLAK